MLKAAKERFYKDKYHEARREAYNGPLKKNETSGVYTTDMLWALREMAINNVWPDGSFGDDECEVWGFFHRLCDKS